MCLPYRRGRTLRRTQRSGEDMAFEQEKASKESRCAKEDSQKGQGLEVFSS